MEFFLWSRNQAQQIVDKRETNTWSLIEESAEEFRNMTQWVNVADNWS
jgi:hypothetical protein